MVKERRKADCLFYKVRNSAFWLTGASTHPAAHSKFGGDAGLADCFTLKNFQNEKDTTTLHFCNRLRLAV